MGVLEKWAIGLSGWAGYHILVFHILKDQADDKDEKFNYRCYWAKNWDDFLVSFLFTIPIVYWGPEIHVQLMTILSMTTGMSFDLPWSDVFYAGPGIFVQVAVWLLKILFKKVKEV